MPTIYVSNSTANGYPVGNDTTGTGSPAAPYLTLHKAISAAAAGDTVLLNDGTYAENSGSGYLFINNKAPASDIAIAPIRGSLGSVTITGASGNDNVIVGGTTGHLRFSWVTFGFRANTCLQGVRNAGGSNLSNIYFDHCSFQIRSDDGTERWGFKLTSTTNESWSAITLDACTFSVIGTGSATAISAQHTGGTGTTSGITVANCAISANTSGVRLLGVAGCVVRDSTIATGTSYAMQIGTDGPAGLTSSGTVSNCTISSTSGHAVIFGAGVNSGSIADSTISGGDNALVLKECSNVVAERCTIKNGTANSLYLKGAQSCVVRACAIENTVGGTLLKAVANPETGTKIQNNTVRNCWLHAGGTALLLNWGAASEDAGGSSVDGNAYRVDGSAAWGSVRGTTVASLAAVRAAWSGYTPSGNDAASVVPDLALAQLARVAYYTTFPATDLVDAPTAYGFGGTEFTGTGMNATTLAAALDARNVTSERLGTLPTSGTVSTLTAQGVWEYSTRTLTSFGTLASDVANAVLDTIRAITRP